MQHFDRHWIAALVLGPPVIALMSRFPLVLTRSAGGIEVGFDSAVLVFLVCFDGGAGALAVWSVGQVCSQLSVQKRWDTRCFNVGIGILAGAGAILVMRSISPMDNTSPRELAAVGLGCAVYFLVDYVISGVSIAVEDRSSILEVVRGGSGFIALGIFVAIDSLGYLGALVVRALPGWASILLAVPLLTILVATRALSRGNEHRRRLAALFEAAAAAQALQSPGDLLDMLRTHTRSVVVSGGADLRDEPPSDREIGARVSTESGDVWLVAPARNRARASVDADRQALEALATVGEQALARLTMVDRDGPAGPARLADRAAEPDALPRPGRAGGGTLAPAGAADRRAVPGPGRLQVGERPVRPRRGRRAVEHGRGTPARAASGKVTRSPASAATSSRCCWRKQVDPRTSRSCPERLLEVLRSEIVIAGHDVVVGTSIGVAIAAPGDDAAALLRNADMAMYRAKAMGKNRDFVYQPSLREENIRRLELIEALRRGIADELVVHYQPVVDLSDGHILGMEALVRWQRAGELVQPDAFIAAAEESGLIVEIGERVLAQVIADAPILVAAAGGPLSLGVNMSAHQLREPSFLEQVRAAVVSLGESQLVLEMTETVVVQEDEESGDALRLLRAAGAMLAIDDFGVGFSSIGYLQHLPVGMIKIDRTFTRDIDSDARAAALVEAILLMGSALELQVVAEGIERPSQVQRLRGSGCTVGQGFLYGRPQPLADVVARLQADRPAHEGSAGPAVPRLSPSRAWWRGFGWATVGTTYGDVTVSCPVLRGVAP